jgi:uncharacterized protein (DUF849 family)
MTAEPFILNFAPTGVVARRDTDDHVPLDSDRIATEVIEAARIGITIAHLHVRDEDGAPTLDPDRYARLIRAIRRECPELVLCVSLSGRRGAGLETRLAPLALTDEDKPDMASLTLSSLNFSREPSVSAPEVISSLAQGITRAGIVPELEVFDSGMVNMARLFLSRGLLTAPCYFNILLGNPSTAQATPLELGTLLAGLPPGSLWAAAGLGRYQKTAHFLGLAAGGGLRTGLEDNFYADLARTRKASNLDMIREAHHLAAILERPLMTSAEFRRRMQMSPGHGNYGRPQPTPAP